MHIFNARPVNKPANAAGFRGIGRFNLQITPEVTLYDLTLVETPTGKLLLHSPPTVYDAPSSSMSPTLRAEIVERAKMIFKDEIKNECQHAA
ncbi:hypothetical protein NKI30_19510 [Mesorhizobium opportunistum]|uniref:hypothetical protein n=1 Tax=Mesorhizobium opportunistum TaxID=593909 RepID=UPI00333AE764